MQKAGSQAREQLENLEPPYAERLIWAGLDSPSKKSKKPR